MGESRSEVADQPTRRGSLAVGIALFIVALLIVIMVHEAGHFTAAKKLGFKATKFFVGFGPTLWSRQKGETEYGVKAIPAGGFVKIVGMNPYEEVAPEDESRAYSNRPRWQRAIVILAGPATHWPLAFIVLLITFMTVGVTTVTNGVETVQERVDSQPSPAAQAGLQTGDEIVAVNGAQVDDWEDVRGFIREHPNETVDFRIERDDRSMTIEADLATALVTPEGQPVEYAAFGENLEEPTGGNLERVGFLGVSPVIATEKPGFVGAIGESGSLLGEYTVASVGSIGDFFGGLFNGDFFDQIEQTGRPQGTGIVGAGRVVAQSAGQGNWEAFAHLMVTLTIFIGLVNLLPLVPLDGGHLLVIVWEKITGKAVDMRKLIPLAAAVLAFFVILSVVFLYYDIVQPPDIGL
jgi:membrane-associated protease RseP (regulator of RpoE activity)